MGPIHNDQHRWVADGAEFGYNAQFTSVVRFHEASCSSVVLVEVAVSGGTSHGSKADNDVQDGTRSSRHQHRRSCRWAGHSNPRRKLAIHLPSDLSTQSCVQRILLPTYRIRMELCLGSSELQHPLTNLNLNSYT